MIDEMQAALDRAACKAVHGTREERSGRFNIMTWHTIEVTPTTYMISADDLVVGSIAVVDGRWLVEILWSGPSGDVRGEFTSQALALAFIEGAEKMANALRDMVR